MVEIQAVHIRYAAGSTNLLNFLTLLGYKECKSEGYGLSIIKTYKIDGTKKRVRVSFNEIDLFEIIDNKEISQFKGFTIHDELLKFFSTRELNNLKSKDNATNI